MYVLITAIVFYIIIYHRIDQYVSSLINLNKAYEDLDQSHANSLKLESQLYKLAYYDELTGLPNKISLQQQVKKLIEKGSNNNQFAFVYFDIDEFRHVNEIMGHYIGDQLIKLVAVRLTDNLGKDAIISRMSVMSLFLSYKLTVLMKLRKKLIKFSTF